jgi:hypothetical protein
LNRARKPDAFRERAAEALRGSKRQGLERVSGWSLGCARAVRDRFDACAARSLCASEERGPRDKYRGGGVFKTTNFDTP